MEVGNIIACDRAFGEHLTKCVWQSRHKNMLNFQDRPAREKIFRGDNETPTTFIQNIARASNDKRIKLPVIGYSRDAGFGPDGMTAVERSFKDVLTIEGIDKEYPIEHFILELNYQVLVVASARMEATEVAFPLYRHMRENRFFKVRYRFLYQDGETETKDEEGAAVDGLVLAFKARIMDPRMSAYSDLKVNIPESLPQFFALRASYEVRAPIVFMDKVEPDESEVELMDIRAV